MWCCWWSWPPSPLWSFPTSFPFFDLILFTTAGGTKSWKAISVRDFSLSSSITSKQTTFRNRIEAASFWAPIYNFHHLVNDFLCKNLKKSGYFSSINKWRRRRKSNVENYRLKQWNSTAMIMIKIVADDDKNEDIVHQLWFGHPPWSQWGHSWRKSRRAAWWSWKARMIIIHKS